METAINYTNKDTAFFSSDEKKWINKIRKLQNEYPDLVTVIAQPESNDGCIYAKIPAAWFALRAPIKRELTDDQKRMAKERMARARSAKISGE